MPIQFPAPQTTPRFTAVNGTTYQWNGAAWDSAVAAGAGTGGGVGGGAAAPGQEFVSISPTPPQNPAVGSLWVDPAGGRPDLKLWDGARWISAVEGVDGIVDRQDGTGQRTILGIGVVDAGVMP